jgi:lipoyl(octanoyl) transferase
MDQVTTSKVCLLDSSLILFDSDRSYNEVLDLQLEAVDKVIRNAKKNEIYVLAGEHNSTYTGGNSVAEEKLEALKNTFEGDVVKTERGGQFMYHGPGQLTMYFIFSLKNHFSGPKEFMNHIFEFIKKYFEDVYELELEIRDQGLWLNDKKVGYMGIRIKSGVIYHGISINYNCDLKHFLNQPPCDIRGDQAGNIFASPLASMYLKDDAKKIAEAYLLSLRAKSLS